MQAGTSERRSSSSKGIWKADWEHFEFASWKECEDNDKKAFGTKLLKSPPRDTRHKRAPLKNVETASTAGHETLHTDDFPSLSDRESQEKFLFMNDTTDTDTSSEKVGSPPAFNSSCSFLFDIDVIKSGHQYDQFSLGERNGIQDASSSSSLSTHSSNLELRQTRDFNFDKCLHSQLLSHKSEINLSLPRSKTPIGLESSMFSSFGIDAVHKASQSVWVDFGQDPVTSAKIHKLGQTAIAGEHFGQMFSIAGTNLIPSRNDDPASRRAIALHKRSEVQEQIESPEKNCNHDQQNFTKYSKKNAIATEVQSTTRNQKKGHDSVAQVFRHRAATAMENLGPEMMEHQANAKPAYNEGNAMEMHTDRQTPSVSLTQMFQKRADNVQPRDGALVAEQKQSTFTSTPNKDVGYGAEKPIKRVEASVSLAQMIQRRADNEQRHPGNLASEQKKHTFTSTQDKDAGDGAEERIKRVAASASSAQMFQKRADEPTKKAVASATLVQMFQKRVDSDQGRHGTLVLEQKKSKFTPQEKLVGNRAGEPTDRATASASLAQMFQRRADNDQRYNGTLVSKQRQRKFTSTQDNDSGNRLAGEPTDRATASASLEEMFQKRAGNDQGQNGTLVSEHRQRKFTSTQDNDSGNRSAGEPTDRATTSASLAQMFQTRADNDQGYDGALVLEQKQSKFTAIQDNDSGNRSASEPTDRATASASSAKMFQKRADNDQGQNGTLVSEHRQRKFTSTQDNDSGNRSAGEPTDRATASASLAKMFQTRADAGSTKAALSKDKTGLSNAHEQDGSISEGDAFLDQLKDPKFIKYAKMLKIGLPADAVQNAMLRDGICPAKPQDQAPLTDDALVKIINEGPQFAKYAKMLKVGLPITAVKNAMERDNVGLCSSGRENKSDVNSGDPIQRFRIHWSTHKNIRSNTVWAMIGRETHWLQNIEIDKDEMEKLFQKERNTPTKKSEQCVTSTESINVPRIIEPKRANNCGIILARIKLSYQEIAEAIEKIDDRALTLEQIKGIMDFIPTQEEAQELKKCMEGNKNQVFRVECEKFMAELLKVPDAKVKLEAMAFVKSLPICIEELKNGKLQERSRPLPLQRLGS
jgi:hypothetical protein